MTKLLCIDPGTKDSGIVFYDGKIVLEARASVENNSLIHLIKHGTQDKVIIEMVSGYGMAVGKEVFETCVWIGRFMEASRCDCKRIFRKDIKLTLCNSLRAKDKNVRQALLDRFPRYGGGKTPQVGTKKQHGALYGVSSHAWSALAVGVTWFENPGVAI